MCAYVLVFVITNINNYSNFSAVDTLKFTQNATDIAFPQA